MIRILLFMLIFATLITIAAWLRYGGGEPYPDQSTIPLLGDDALEEVLAYREPVGDVAISADGRLFFAVHPESRPEGNRLLEYVDGASVPYPDVESQFELFDTLLGLAVDRQGRLWAIDHGNHGFRDARLVGFDLDSNRRVHDQVLPHELAPAGSYLHDLVISHDNKTIIIADMSIWRVSPALIVYDIATGKGRRVLENAPSVVAENYRIRTEDRDLTYLGGVVALKAGVDGIVLDTEWLYFGALSGSGLYRVRLADLRDDTLVETELAARVERFTTKPLSDAFSMDSQGNVYLADVEHHGVAIVDAERNLRTLIRSPEIRWPDALSFGPDGWLYIADSALPELILHKREHIQAQQPYRIYRVRTGIDNVPAAQ